MTASPENTSCIDHQKQPDHSFLQLPVSDMTIFRLAQSLAKVANY